MSADRCAGCGATRRQLNRDSASGDVLCESCFCRRPGDVRVDDETFAASERKRSRAADRSRRQPDWIAAVLASIRAQGLPVDGLGIPGLAITLCPLCGAPTSVRFHSDALEITCAAGCGENDVAQRLGLIGGAR